MPGDTAVPLPPRRAHRRSLGAPWALLAVLGAFFASSILIVPTLAPVAIQDDFIFARVVQSLVREHRWEFGDLPAMILVAQAVWGAVFSWIFGFSFGVLRVSTLAVTGVGAVSLYGLARELGVSKDRAAAGAAVFLFSPLHYALAHSFMSEMHYVSWLLASTWAFARARRLESLQWTVAGSGLAAVAVLVRQQGALIPLAVALTVVIAERRRLGVGTVGRVVCVGLIPLLALAGYYLLMGRGEGVPAAQGMFVGQLEGFDLDTYLSLAWRLPYLQLILVGLTCAPVLVGVLRWRHVRALTAGGPLAWTTLSALALMEAAFLAFLFEGGLAPFFGTWVSAEGLGPTDLLGSRPVLMGRYVRIALTLGAAVAAVAVLSLVVAALARRVSPLLWVPLAVLIGQALGAVPPSLTFTRVYGLVTLDRYLLPVAALSIPVLLASLTGRHIRMRPVWAVVIALGALSAAGTRDQLVYQHALWSTADSLLRQGVPARKIDAGPAWDGWHVSDGTLYLRTPRTPYGLLARRAYDLDDSVAPHRVVGAPLDPRLERWWVDQFAPLTDSTYTVLHPNYPYGGPRYEKILGTVEYSSWLHRRRTFLQVRMRLPTSATKAPRRAPSHAAP